MSRFSEPQHEHFRALNTLAGASTSGCGRYDVAQSRAHARMLAARGDHLRRPTATRCSRASTPSRPSWRRARSRSRDDDEDIHMAVERRLTEIAGPVGGKLHTARSRNDQVATDVALFTRAARRGATIAAIERLCAALRGGRRGATSTGRCPATRTCSAASRSTCRHHLLAYFWMLLRDRDALPRSSSRRRRRCRWAPARWPGTNFDTDRGDGGRRARLRARRAQLDRRGGQPRLRPRLPRRRGDVRDAPLPARRRDRPVVDRGVRLPDAVRRLDERLVDHAAEEEPRRRRAAARPRRRGSSATSSACTASCTRCR